MKRPQIRPVIISLILCFHIYEAQSQSTSNLRDEMPLKGKVVFLGNSITYAGHYFNQFTAAWLLHTQNQEVEFINLGLPSETVSGLSEEGHANGKFPRPNLHDRLDRILKILEPDLIFACYGMNDGIYLPFDESRFALYTEGMERLKRKAKESGASIIFLTPPIFDPLHGKDYAEVLHMYSDWLLGQKPEDGWEVIDIHWPMHELLEKERTRDNDFFLAKDGIHPDELGHWLMAKQLLLANDVSHAINVKDSNSFFQNHPNGLRILELCTERNERSRDYWLEKTGHERPGLSKGLPKEAYQETIGEIDRKIAGLLNTK